MDNQAKLATPENTMSEHLKPKPSDFRKKEQARSHHVRIYPVPDISNIKAKVNSFMRYPKIEGEEEKVSGAVTHSAVQK
jgi:hypothetical protein